MTDRRTSRSIRRRKRQKRKKIISIILILIIIGIVISVLLTQFAYLLRPVDNDRKNIVGLYAEPKNSLDMIYVGASSVYRSWSPLEAYNDHGIASYSLATQGMPASSVKNMILEANKTQDPKLYVIDISPFMQMSTDKEYTLKHIARISNSMKYSANRFDAISNFGQYTFKDMTGKEKLKLNADIIMNRHNISNLDKESLQYRGNDVESQYKGFRLKKYKSKELSAPDDAREISDTYDINPETYDVLDDLFAYIEDEKINTLFTYVPREITEETKPIYNTLEKYISDKGYKFYDSIDHYEDMDIDFSKDFYDKNHLNYIGASKYTDYFSEYLTNKYKFPDRRKNDDYKEWEKDYEQYKQDVNDAVYSLGMVSGDTLYSLRPIEVNRNNIVGYYAEPENTLDVVFIGPSSFYRSWTPLQAWNEQGFASYTFGTAGMPASAFKHMLVEAEKTQNPELYIIDVSPFMQITGGKNYKRKHIFRLANGLSYSANRSRLIEDIKKYSIPDLTDDEMEAYLFDVITNKNNQGNINEQTLIYKDNKVSSPYKGYRLEAKATEEFLLPYGVTDDDDTTDIDDRTYELMDNILEYIENENLNVLFTYPPRYIDYNTKPIYNTIEEYLKEKGYDFYDSMDKIDEMDIDFSKDLYNPIHLNHLGAIKYTGYFGDYLSEKYKFKDKRKLEEYESWNKGYSKYEKRSKEVESSME